MNERRARLLLAATGAGLTAIAVRRARRACRACRRSAGDSALAEVATASGADLADRVRTALGPLEREQDLPRIHLYADRHVVVLHGEVPSTGVAQAIVDAARAVNGVEGVESHLHVGFVSGDTRPSADAGRPSEALLTLRAAALRHGAGEHGSALAVRAVLSGLSDALPTHVRTRLGSHLPSDVADLLVPPDRHGESRAPLALADLLTSVIDRDAFAADKAPWVVGAVLQALRELVPADADAVTAALPADMARVWTEER